MYNAMLSSVKHYAEFCRRDQFFFKKNVRQHKINKMGSLDLEDLATYRLQLSKRHVEVRLGQWVRS
jgi:hypothetical protein